MKSLLTRSVTQSWLLSSVLVSSQALSPLPALSIPDEVIVQKLQSVPVYTILDKLDKFVSTGNDNGTGTKIMYVLELEVVRLQSFHTDEALC